MRDDDLRRQLRERARALEARSRAASADDVLQRRPPRGPARWRAPALAAAAVLAVVGGGALWLTARDDQERVDVVTPAPETTTTITTTTTSTPEPTTTLGPVIAPEDLPSAGIVIRRGDEPGSATLFGLDGERVTDIDSPAVDQLGTGTGTSVLAVRPGEELGFDLVAPDPAQAPPDCSNAAGGGGVRVALCTGAAQQPQVVARVTPWGGRSVLLGPLHTDPVTDGPSGHWRWALPSPDGAWVIGQWSGECEVPTAVLLSTTEFAPRAIDGGPLDSTVESRGLGWTPDGQAIVHFGSGECGSSVAEPGVYLVDPATLERTLVVPMPGSSASAWLWQQVTSIGNPLERTFARATSELGLEGCCGEPSHGGDGLTAGVVWMGTEIPVGAAPTVEPAHVPFNDLVISSEPIDLGGVPVTAGEADLGSFIAFTCGADTWHVGGAGAGERATPEQVRGLAEALIPRLYCTVGNPPRASGHGPGGDPPAVVEIVDLAWGCGPTDGRTLAVTVRSRDDTEATIQLQVAGDVAGESGVVQLGVPLTRVVLEIGMTDAGYDAGIGDVVVRDPGDPDRFLTARRIAWIDGEFPACG